MKRILIVDDESSIIEIISEILEGSDYEISTANNGLAAFALFKENPFDLLITDIAMPEMDGVQLIEASLALLPSLKAIVMTGYAHNYDLEELRAKSSLGHIQIFEKPLNLMEILSAANIMLAAETV